MWDALVVVNFIKGMGESTEKLTIKLLSLKLATTLHSSGRASEMSYFDVTFIACEAISAILHLITVTKSW